MSSKVTLTEYFQAVDRRLLREGLLPTAGFRVKVCEELIDLWFPTQELADACRSGLEAFVSEDAGAPDGEFFYWYDRCDAYLPEGEAEHSSVWKSEDATGSLKIGTDDDSLVGCDHVRRRYYFARPKPEKDPYLASRHMMVNAFARWAKDTDKVLLHAAAVGVGGTGVLVAGRGGVGKSTFAISCLADGMEFVSDDYTLITASGALLAMPLYSIVALRSDMCGTLPGFEHPLLEEDGSYRGGKPQFQVPKERFSSRLEIKAMIIPKVANEAEPSIRKVAPGNVMAQLIHSTITQIEARRDMELVRRMASRLSQLPVYEMSMSTDLMKNPAFLRSFIEKEIKNV